MTGGMDPADWTGSRAPGHRMLDDMFDIVCFRVRTDVGPDRPNREIVADLQEAGVAAPSTTTVDGKLAIPAAIVNHRTRTDDVDAMVDAVLERAREIALSARATATGALPHPGCQPSQTCVKLMDQET